MKIAVFGSNGMAGHTIVKYLKSCNYDVTTVARNNANISCDITDISQVDNTLEQLKKYDYIINCIGLLVAPSINRPDLAIKINSWFPRYLEYKMTSSAKIIHLSTDCIFDGSKGPYIESDYPSETNAYGTSKRLGEINNTKDITMRTSIIGPELNADGTGLLNWILTNKDKTVKGYANALWNGITTLQLAKCIEQYIMNPAVTGIYHVVNNQYSISKYNLLCLINDTYQLNKTIDEHFLPKTVNKILVDSRLQYDWNIVDYKNQLNDLLAFTGC